MRINKYIAQATGISRRAADKLISDGKVLIDGQPAKLGEDVAENNQIEVNGKLLPPQLPKTGQLIALNKPVGYVCSRDGQGSKTIYDLLPPELHKLKPIGRLDKDSSGLILLTNDGKLHQQMSHPSFNKEKTYLVTLNRPLSNGNEQEITTNGVDIGDKRPSRMGLFRISDTEFKVSLHEGRNRQIRRTFEAVGYKVISLHRVTVENYNLGMIGSGKFQVL